MLINPPSPNHNSNLPYRLGVGLVIFNKKRHIFMAKRNDTQSEAWQLPQGGLKQNERHDLKQAVFRELLEEIGTTKVQIIAEHSSWTSYDLLEPYIPKAWNGQYRGQKHKWFLLYFTGDDSDINIHTENPEFTDWSWINKELIITKTISFRKSIYKQVLAEFTPIIDNFLK